MNYKEYLIEKLKEFKEQDIIITTHAQEQALFRGVNLKEVKQNILNPVRLTFVGKQTPLHKNEEKYDCYFTYNKTTCHRYILVIGKKCIICTIIKINRRWQKMVEKYAKI